MHASTLGPGSDGYSLVFDEQVRTWRLGQGEPSRLDIEIYGENCGLAGGAPCLRGYLWDPEAGGMIETTNEEGDGYLVGPLFQVVGIGEAQLPEVIKAEVDRRHQACRDRGGEVEGAGYAAVTSPDLNGDGVREWIIGSRFSGCVMPEADGQVSGGVSVWLSHRDTWREGLRVSENGYAVDVSTVPARFGVRPNENCLEGRACVTHFYVETGGLLAPC